MSKKNLQSSAIYLLFAANTSYACIHRDFNWLFWVAAVLTAACLALDILEVRKNAGH